MTAAQVQWHNTLFTFQALFVLSLFYQATHSLLHEQELTQLWATTETVAEWKKMG